MDPTQSLRDVAMRFPPELQRSQLDDVPRMSFHADLICSEGPKGLRHCDVGSGIGLLGLACVLRGAHSIMIDDFRDPVNLRFGDSVLDLHRSMGVEVICADVISERFPIEPETLDVVTSFECIEHLHNSPRRLLHAMRDALKPGGRFILSMPNCVDLKKRLAVPLGRGSWSRFEDWYEPDVFRGHVREADVRDLRRIASDLGLCDVRIMGRCWTAAATGSPFKRAVIRTADRLLRFAPSLCASLYMIGRRTK